MNRCQHTDEQMNDNEEAVNDNMSDKTAKQREREREKERRRDGGREGGGDRNRPKIKRNTGEVKHLLWCLHVSFFPRNKTKWMN